MACRAWSSSITCSLRTIGGSGADGPVVVVNGVLFGGSMDPSGTMFAMNAATGDVLWSFQSGGSVYDGLSAQ